MGQGVEQAEPISDQPWGRLATIKIPGEDVLRIYEPRHPTAIGDAAKLSTNNSETGTQTKA